MRNQEKSHDARAVANLIWEHAPNSFNSYSINMLLYLAHGWSCIEHRIPIVSELPIVIVAAFHPLYLTVFNGWCNNTIIPDMAILDGNNAPYTAELSQSQEMLLSCIVDNYGTLDYGDLVKLTTEEGAPYWITQVMHGSREPIPLRILQMGFRQKVKKLNRLKGVDGTPNIISFSSQGDK